MAEAYNKALQEFDSRQLMLYERTRDDAAAEAKQGELILIACAVVALLLGGGRLSC